MSIFKKIFSVYLLLILLGVTISLLGIYHVYRLNQITQSILAQDLGSRQLENQLMDTFLSQVRYERQYRILGDAELAGFFDEFGQRFQKTLGQLAAIVTDPGQKEEASRLRDLHQQYSQLFHDPAVGAAKGPSGLIRQVEQQKVLLDGITKTLRQMIAQSELLLKSKMEKSDRLAQSAMDQTLLFLGLLVTLGIAAALFLANRITRPIKDLRKATTAFSYGVFDYPLESQSRDEVGILTSAFRRMAEKLKEANQLKEHLLSYITHELKTPLTSLTEAVHLLQEKVAGPITEKQSRLLVIIDEDARRLLRLINDLLDLSRMKAGMLSLQVEPWNLGGLAREAVASLNPLALKKGLQLKLMMKHDPGPLRLDGNRIYQVFTNLISNAVKFTPPGGVVVVSVSIYDGSLDEVQVSVADTGIGIPREDRQRIFDRFYQLESFPSGKGEGFGLGLSIARHIVKAHGGRIWVESEPPQGSTFFFTLPIRRGMKRVQAASPAVERVSLGSAE
jgi:signal transduction histidine kinase